MEVDELAIAKHKAEHKIGKIPKWSDVVDKPSSFTPSAHKASHENSGSDEISVAGLSGELADAQTPKAHTHPESDITGLDKYTQAQVNALLAEKSNKTISLTTGEDISQHQIVCIGKGRGRRFQSGGRLYQRENL